MLYLFIWIGLALIVGAIGKDKTVGFGGGFFLSILLSPLIGFIIVIASKDKSAVTKKIIRCDGCREVIEGDYIRITPKGTKDIYDYCSKECRNQYHPNYMKEKGIVWTPPIEDKPKEIETDKE